MNRIVRIILIIVAVLFVVYSAYQLWSVGFETGRGQLIVADIRHGDMTSDNLQTLSDTDRAAYAAKLAPLANLYGIFYTIGMLSTLAACIYAVLRAFRQRGQLGTTNLTIIILSLIGAVGFSSTAMVVDKTFYAGLGIAIMYSIMIFVIAMVVFGISLGIRRLFGRKAIVD